MASRRCPYLLSVERGRGVPRPPVGEPPMASRLRPYLLSAERGRGVPRPPVGEPPMASRRCPYLLSVERGRGGPRPPANQANTMSFRALVEKSPASGREPSEHDYPKILASAGSAPSGEGTVSRRAQVFGDGRKLLRASRRCPYLHLVEQVGAFLVRPRVYRLSATILWRA